MAWATNTEHQQVVPGLKVAAKNTYNTWARAINGGRDPKTAANGWDSDYEVLKSATVKGKKLKFCSIRLTQEHRVYFVQNDADKICEIRKVGSHAKPSGF
jgi:hypothetical protein